MAEEESNSKPSYPLKVFYCGNCSLPPEYCDFSSDTDRCREWLEKYLPDEFNRIMTCTGTAGGDDSDEKKRQKRGGKGMVKSKKKDDGPKQVNRLQNNIFINSKSQKQFIYVCIGIVQVCLSRAPRGKKKSVTVVTGLSTFNIDLKVAAKFFGTKFACGSSVTGEDEIVIQGDVKDDLFDIIPEKWPEIDEDYIEDLGDLKR